MYKTTNMFHKNCSSARHRFNWIYKLASSNLANANPISPENTSTTTFPSVCTSPPWTCNKIGTSGADAVHLLTTSQCASYRLSACEDKLLVRHEKAPWAMSKEGRTSRRLGLQQPWTWAEGPSLNTPRKSRREPREGVLLVGHKVFCDFVRKLSGHREWGMLRNKDRNCSGLWSLRLK